MFDIHLQGQQLDVEVKHSGLKESEVLILRRTVRSTVTAMCAVQLKDRKWAEDLMVMSGLNETVYQMDMAN